MAIVREFLSEPFGDSMKNVRTERVGSQFCCYFMAPKNRLAPFQFGELGWGWELKMAPIKMLTAHIKLDQAKLHRLATKQNMTWQGVYNGIKQRWYKTGA